VITKESTGDLDFGIAGIGALYSGVFRFMPQSDTQADRRTGIRFAAAGPRSQGCAEPSTAKNAAIMVLGLTR